MPVHDPFAGPKYKGLAPWQVEPASSEGWQSEFRRSIKPPTSTKQVAPGGISAEDLARFSETGKIFGPRDPEADKARQQMGIPQSLKGDTKDAVAQRENGSGHVGDVIHADYGAPIPPMPQVRFRRGARSCVTLPLRGAAALFVFFVRSRDAAALVVLSDSPSPGDRSRPKPAAGW